MKIGDRVQRVPLCFGEKMGEGGKKLPGGGEKFWGVVVYIHPKGRFHTVEFETGGGVLRENFRGV